MRFDELVRALIIAFKLCTWFVSYQDQQYRTTVALYSGTVYVPVFL